MTLNEETLRLGDEFDRLDGELDDVAGKLGDVEGGTTSAQMLQRHANDVETQLGGVATLADEYGEDATITVAGLDAGMYARVQDRVAAMRAQRDEPGDMPGGRSNVFAAMALVDAPFLNLDNADDELDGKIVAVTSQPIGVAKWLEARGNDLTTVSEGNFKPLAERLAETSED